MRFQANVGAFLLTSSLVGRVSGQDGTDNAIETETPVTFFDNCDADVYYSELLAGDSDPTQWSRESLENLVRSTHRNQLPVTGDLSGDDDVYHAIIDLDPGATEGTVLLVYRETEMGAFPNANPLYWDVERLWPAERGYNRFSPAFTDVHQVKPADSTVLLPKGILLWHVRHGRICRRLCVTRQFRNRGGYGTRPQNLAATGKLPG